ncbi:aminoglycoside phosphotransferase family protein [Paenibacillus dakarensis]|uniref:aminoglycoside phosphotransferase family protein n=1 Tax=Paenibacillus dakarensis TaxID=1527293 RepID=UPI001FDF988F|nr:aminoglycoside phosphotransferase family protein [Paenibacillus dakarensis]
MSQTCTIDKDFILKTWHHKEFFRKIQHHSRENVLLDHSKMECLKDSYKSSIWRLQMNAGSKTYPIILKISKQLKKARSESTVEKNIYRKARKVLQPFMPQVLFTKKNVNGRDLWVFMENIDPIKERVQYNPDHFGKIIPALAKLHASTMGKRFKQQEQLFSGWLPRFNSKEALQENQRLNQLSLFFLEEAMKIRDLNPIVQPYYSLIKDMLKKGPGYFPEVAQSGCCIIHGDLHTANIVCPNVNEDIWDVKFIDWEGAKYAPCWLDLVNLVGLFLAYRKEWKDQEDEITHRCVRLYEEEMRKNGVVFNTNPIILYEKAYLKKILEKGLYLQLNWAVTGKKEARLLHCYLEKAKVLGERYVLN